MRHPERREGSPNNWGMSRDARQDGRFWERARYLPNKTSMHIMEDRS